MTEALDHVRRALECLSLHGETVPLIGDKPGRKFTMGLAEDIDRINGHLPSPMFVALSERIREAWEELKMAEAELSK